MFFCDRSQAILQLKNCNKILTISAKYKDNFQMYTDFRKTEHI